MVRSRLALLSHKDGAGIKKSKSNYEAKGLVAVFLAGAPVDVDDPNTKPNEFKVFLCGGSLLSKLAKAPSTPQIGEKADFHLNFLELAPLGGRCGTGKRSPCGSGHIRLNLGQPAEKPR